jgi:hypothetical protein
MKPAYAKFGVSAHLVLVPVIQHFHLHLALRVNLPSQALAAHFRAVVPHLSAAQAPVLLHFRLALHLVLRLALSHHLAAVALSPHRVLLSPAHAAALRLAIQRFRLVALQAVSLRVQAVHRLLAVLHLVLAHRVRVLHPVIQPSLLLAPLAAHLVAPHHPLQARASKSYRASISIQIANKMDGLLLLWDLDRVSQIE